MSNKFNRKKFYEFMNKVATKYRIKIGFLEYHSKNNKIGEHEEIRPSYRINVRYSTKEEGLYILRMWYHSDYKSLYIITRKPIIEQETRRIKEIIRY